MTKMKSVLHIVAALALAVFASTSQAQSYGAGIGAEAAKKVAAATVGECTKNN